VVSESEPVGLSILGTLQGAWELDVDSTEAKYALGGTAIKFVDIQYSR
jgi:hypothetical protein